ncbi:MAG: FAD-dependent oxidoreductase [Acidimicrobiales bacterium]
MTATPKGGPTDVIVIGAGVSGLTTAVCLAEQGHNVRIWSADPIHETTSMAGGAMWGPYLVEPADKVKRWSETTLDLLRQLSSVEGTGVRLVTGLEASRDIADPPDWAKDLDDFRVARADELPPGFESGVRFTAPMVDMPVYLSYLQARLRAAGGSIEMRRIASLDEALTDSEVVINCSGVGARNLVPDPELTAIRGQLVSIENVGIDEFFSEETGDSADLLHIYPHDDSVILGGVAQPGNWSLDPDPATAQAIIDRCSTIEPRIREAAVLGHRVGLRPTRAKVRVERQAGEHGFVVHNYGHGGAGVSLSWGCAQDVQEFVKNSDRQVET